MQLRQLPQVMLYSICKFIKNRSRYLLGQHGLSLGLGLLFVAVIGWMGLRSARAIGESSKFQIAQLLYEQSGPTRNQALMRLLRETHRRTSVDPQLRIVEIRANDPKLFSYPLLYLAGDTGFSPWPQSDVLRLRNYLMAGGTLFIDMTDGDIGSDFDLSVRRLVKRIFPHNPLEKLKQEHSLYRSFYLIRRFGGRRLLQPYLEGVTRDDRTPIIYSMNDHIGSWERDNFGNWVYPVTPGGDSQREHAFRFGINLIMYALCVNYKQDAVHVPIIMRRGR